MSHFIPALAACEKLGISNSNLHNASKYRPYYKKSTKGSRDAMFDIGGYLKHEDLKVELIEKVKLFTEYLYHIEGMKYAQIARISKTQQNSIGKLDYGYKAALSILVRFNEFYPFHLRRFHEYYGFSIKGIKYAKLIQKTNIQRRIHRRKRRSSV